MSANLWTKIEHVEVVLCFGSRPHKPVRREMRLAKMDTQNKKQKMPSKLFGTSGGLVRAEHMDRKTGWEAKVKHAERKKNCGKRLQMSPVAAEALMEEADFGKEMEKQENFVIPGKMANAATAHVGLICTVKGILEGKKNSRNRGGGLPLHWDSEKRVKEDPTKRFLDTKGPLAWVNLSQEVVGEE